jgi:hypothetical protein
MISKEKLKAHIDKFPDDEISIDELIERLIFIEKLEKRISLSESGESMRSENEINKEMDQWSK